MAADSDLRGVWRQYVATGTPVKNVRVEAHQELASSFAVFGFLEAGASEILVHETDESVTVEASRLRPRIAQHFSSFASIQGGPAI